MYVLYYATRSARAHVRYENISQISAFRAVLTCRPVLALVRDVLQHGRRHALGAVFAVAGFLEGWRLCNIVFLELGASVAAIGKGVRRLRHVRLRAPPRHVATRRVVVLVMEEVANELFELDLENAGQSCAHRSDT